MKISFNTLWVIFLLGGLQLNSFAQNTQVDERSKRMLIRFPEADLNKDGKLTREEFKEFRERRGTGGSGRKGRQSAELAPTHKDVKYGDHEKQAFDIWLAESIDGKKTPLVIFIHGGGFRGGGKGAVSGKVVQSYLDQGISFASMNYRLSDVGPYPIMMNDSARGLQFIRSKAEEWNLDSKHVACYGGSAGAGISLWLGFHEDLADPESEDLVARQSTRIVAAATQNGQSTYDMRTFREWFGVPNLKPESALIPFYAIKSEADWDTQRVKKLMTDASPISHLSKDDVPVFMAYGKGDVPIDENSPGSLWVHHARLGLKLKEAMDKLGLECHVTWRDHPSKEYRSLHAFLSAKLKEE